MCGISALLHHPHVPSAPSWPFWSGIRHEPTPSQSEPLSLTSIFPLLSRRGPSASSSLVLHPTSTSDLFLLQTTLSLRGIPPAPIQSPDVLLYNGELYDTPSFENDRSTMLDSLANIRDPPKTLAALDKLLGPWSIVYWHAETSRLFFARDRLGRRSLLLRVIPGKVLEIVSVAPKHVSGEFFEIPPNGLAWVQLSNNSVEFGIARRETVPVVPRRVQERIGEIVGGSGAEMYVSFLDKSWRRGNWGNEETMEDNLYEADEDNSLDSVVGFLNLFRQSVIRRLVTNREVVSGTARYAVLFSGGIDSLFIAAVLAECLPADESVQLISVAFGEDSHAIMQCPDRRSAILGLDELQKLHPERRFELCCVDADHHLADFTVEEHVQHLISPCNQPMDASIGTAIWLAARAKGYLYKPKGQDNTIAPSNHESLSIAHTAPILFSGLGADELLGGYKGRHRTIHRSEGVQGIKRELDADLSRLWFRNLGRDDRLIADHGKEVRHPFLDESLIDYVMSLNFVRDVCDLSKPDGIGDKQLLRKTAALLGLPDEAVKRSKRAIQFGSRSKQVIERKCK